MTDMTVDLTYKFHPGKFDIFGMESFYKSMAAQGLHLVDRGVFFSSFAKGKPADMDYRVEALTSGGFMWKLTDETKQKYTDCGWEYVCMMGFTAIFRAPAGAATEVYADSREQAASIKKVIKEAYLTLIQLPLLWLILIAIETVTYGNSLPSELFLSFITRTTGIVSVFAALVALEVPDIISALKLITIHHRMKRGKPTDHSPVKNSRMYWIVGVMIFAFAAVGIFTESQNKEIPLPLETDGGYITLSQLGYEGERILHYQFESDILHTDTIFCEYWECSEYTTGDNNENLWLNQKVYRIKGGVKPETVAKALMKTAIFAHEGADFREIQVKGLDKAYSTGNMECIAVKGNMVGIFITTFESENEIADTLTTVARHWEKAE
ncbi:MAG: DUF2812 domain-containing protein [Oscillospiraceae bacterium]|nr:DUF2812 domain-containing protein [Oscillospiraceae bacterium]